MKSDKNLDYHNYTKMIDSYDENNNFIKVSSIIMFVCLILGALLSITFNPTFLLILVPGFLLFCLAFIIKLFKPRQCRKCNQKMIFIYPKSDNGNITYKYICKNCFILIDLNIFRGKATD